MYDRPLRLILPWLEVSACDTASALTVIPPPAPTCNVLVALPPPPVNPFPAPTFETPIEAFS